MIYGRFYVVSMSKLTPLLLSCLLAGCATAPTSSFDPNEIIGVYQEPPPSPRPAPATAVSPPASGTVWTVDEVKTWYTDYVKKEKGGSVGLLYQGSDARHHYFTARRPSTQSWTSMAVLKSALRLEKESPDRHTAQPPHGYGFVDPFNGFRFLPRVGVPPPGA